MAALRNPVPIPPALEGALHSAEQAVQALSDALLQGRAEATEAAAQGLQQCTAELGHAWAATRRNLPGWRPGAEVGRRLQAVQQALALQREACLRRGSHASRALQMLVPAAQDPTYRRGTTAASLHGPARQTGAFRLLSA